MAGQWIELANYCVLRSMQELRLLQLHRVGMRDILGNSSSSNLFPSYSLGPLLRQTMDFELRIDGSCIYSTKQAEDLNVSPLFVLFQVQSHIHLLFTIHVDTI